MPTTLPRVALFSGNYNYVRDGANQALNLLVGYLLKQGVAARVYSPTAKRAAFAPVGDLVSVPALPVPLGGRSEYKFARGIPSRVRRDLDAFQPDIVHVSSPELLGHAAVRYARSRGIPAVASLHTRFETYGSYYKMPFLEPILVWMLTRFYNKFDRVLVPTPSMAALLTEWGVTTPISIWSRGIDHQRFQPSRRSLEWRRSMGIEDGDVAIGFLGRLVKEKGLAIFAEVLAELRSRGVPHKVLVIGKGPARDWFAAQAPGAIFAGFQSGDDLGRAVASMDVFFNPSLTETFGNVTTEAMAAGIPVVAARATGAVDLVVDGETGFLAPPDDRVAYADAIERIVADPVLRERLGRASFARAAGYRWDAANSAVLTAYREVLDDVPSRGGAS
ncbi:Glycosyltransferase involved in cell wall bisynthesis [Sphingomonas gellani]|uniref:Glycosyltransferase involved in cell wall bisynthesis n=1 Tax=Sphingomonas gellani TaxID=1166340 RepID=A0A1H7ZLT5_9SPHN|nr:glycosyltransferase family 1 protein [Sphingomonas gellani]SEM58407.1 Glycosyltransferase involved in cell wall bisynthesis [Sphingomonas gellani]